MIYNYVLLYTELINFYKRNLKDITFSCLFLLLSLKIKSFTLPIDYSFKIKNIKL